MTDDRSDLWKDILQLSRKVDAELYGIDRDKLEKRMTARQLQGIQKTLTGLVHRLHELTEEAERD